MNTFGPDAVYRYWLAQNKAHGLRRGTPRGMGRRPMSAVDQPVPPAPGHAANDAAFDQAGGVPRGAVPALPGPSTRLGERYLNYVDNSPADYDEGSGR